MKRTLSSIYLSLVVILLSMLFQVSVFAQVAEDNTGSDSSWLIGSVNWDAVTPQAVNNSVQVAAEPNKPVVIATSDLNQNELVASTSVTTYDDVIDFQVGSALQVLLSPTVTLTLTPTPVIASTLMPRPTATLKPTATRKPTFASVSFDSATSSVPSASDSGPETTSVAEAVSNSFTATPTVQVTATLPTEGISQIEDPLSATATDQTSQAAASAAEDELFHAPQLLKYFTIAFAGIILLLVLGILLFSKKK